MKGLLPARIKDAIGQRWAHYSSNQRWNHLICQARKLPENQVEQGPVIFFNASTRIQSMSQNAAYSLLASLGLCVNGVPVHYFICSSGLERCILGSNRDDVYQSPPCERMYPPKPAGFQRRAGHVAGTAKISRIEVTLAGDDLAGADSFQT